MPVILPAKPKKRTNKFTHYTEASFAVVKAQIHAGGRGKGSIIGKEQRGVAVAKSAEAVKEIAHNLIGGTLVTIQTGPAGKVVNKILVAQGRLL
ncbi:MAG: ATP-grasp domain-containing protein [Ferruginibacter sp.]